MPINVSTFQSASFFPNGQFSASAWLEYWQALWAAPSAPGFPTLVRDGIAALRDLTAQLLATATTIGEATAAEATELAEIEAVLRTVFAPMAASNDPAVLNASVVQPLLTDPQRPLMRIGSIFTVLQTARPLRSWLDIFDDEIVAPTKKAAKAVGGAIKAGLPILPLAIGGFAIWYFFFRGNE